MEHMAMTLPLQLLHRGTEHSQSELFLFFLKTIYTVLALSQVLNAAKCADKIGKDLECNTLWVGTLVLL